jgi:hypothetical protein
MRIFRLVLLLFISFGVADLCVAQTPESDKQKKEKKKKHFEPNNAVLFSPHYVAQFPFGDMADRFGFNNVFGFQITGKIKKNWLIGGEGGFIFGTKVREGYVLNNISTATGQFISQNNDIITVNPQEQGFEIKVHAGKIIPFSEKYPDAGLLFLTGFGLLQHKIAINVKGSSLPQLDKTYRTGYDRMANGPVISQFIGGIFMGRKKYINAYAGVQFDVAFTQGRRSYDFFLERPLNDKRVDMFLGIRVGWVLPVFLQSSEKEYFY